MALVTRTWRDLRRLLGPDAWFTYCILAALVTLEIVGRRTGESDIYDFLSAAVLALLAALTFTRHRQSPLSWLSLLEGLARRVRGFFQTRALDIGVDLRGTPPLPRGMPPRASWIAGSLIGATIAILLFHGWLPFGLRAIGVRVFYLGYLTLLMGLWAVLLLCILIAFVIPTAIIHDNFVSRYSGGDERARRAEFLCLSMYFGGLLLTASLLPPWVSLAVCGLAMLTNVLTIAVPANPDVSFVWRFRQGEERIRCIPWGQWVICEFSLLTLGTLDVILLACGSAILNGSVMAQDTMPVTTVFGLVLTWLAPGAMWALVVQALLGRLRDPARPCPPTVHISGEDIAEHRKAVSEFFRENGWKVRFAPAAPDPLDVPVVVETGANPGGEPRWPLRIDPRNLMTAAALERLARRDEIQKRRRLVGGLERLFKIAARRSFKCGSGFWVAPHYWFVPGLSRDTQEDEINLAEGTVLSGIIGPPYHGLFARSVRHHVYQILRGVQIDLIFVEDGVGYRRFLRVLRMLFEVYDMHGGRRRAEEVHFHGLPGTRVMIHEFELNEPFRSEVYPEPDYENLGRARILHVFRDRGEQITPLEEPLDTTRLPAPSLAR